MQRLLFLCVMIFSSTAAISQEGRPGFKEQVIDPNVGVGYAVTVADINHDRKTDIVVVTENPDQVVWYENPSWTRRIIVEGFPKLPVCVQPLDVDNDGKVELILGADWQPSNTKTGGTVWLLQRPSDLSQPWTPIKLDEEPTMHRMRAIDADGKGKKELVCSSLHGREATGPEWWKGAGASLYVLRRPANPFKEPWKREVISDELHITHNVWTLDWDKDGKEEILAAAYEGVFLFKKAADGKWAKQRIGAGDPEKHGAGEVKVGRLPGGKLYIATVEPWHGHQAVVYTPPDQADRANQLWKRQVLVEDHKGGHAVWTADLTGAGIDSLVVGFRGPPEGKVEDAVVYLLHPDNSGAKWEKRVLDAKGLGSEDVICADLNGDGKVDIIGVGRSTKNLKIYWNEGQWK
ncbi:MAG TPA: VCBS repeat-containing protein [Blastocatellia bacterium]|nr:VCBS repeat-containing protein [Blastocatellia bacterium]